MTPRQRDKAKGTGRGKPHLFPAAITYATGAVKSILRGSILPDKIVLYLTFAQFEGKPLPEELTELTKQYPIFEIRDYDRDIRSYRKLVLTLKDFPEAVIVTIDDDTNYHKTMLEDLLKVHRLFPEDIIAHRAKRIKPDKPYRKWRKFKWYDFIFKRWHRSFRNIQTGVGGVLYPPHALKKEMNDVELFTKIAPTVDDILVRAMAVANGRRIIPVPFGHNKPKGLGKPRAIALKTVNFKSGTDRNSPALKAIADMYPEIRSRLENEL